MAQFFSTDKINANTQNTSQVFSTDGDGNLVITESFVTTLNPAQTQDVLDALQQKITNTQAEATASVAQCQSVLDGINNVL